MNKVSGNKLVEIYLYALFSFLILRSINVYSLLPSVIDSIAFMMLAIFGAVIILYNFFQQLRNKSVISYDLFLILFLIIMFLTSLLNFKYGITNNIKTIIWSAIYFLIIYAFSSNEGLSKNFYNIILKTLVYAYFLISLFSLAMYLFQYSYFRPGDLNTRVRIGFLESRLFGLYGDPNFGGVIALIVVLVSLYCLINRTLILNRIFLWINIVIQMILIILTGSRSAVLLGMIAAAICTFLFTLNIKQLQKRNVILRWLISLLAAIVVVIGLNFIIEVLKNYLQRVPELFAIFKDSTNTPKQKIVDEVSLTRHDVAQSTDISNLRFSIWKSAFQLFESRWLFGVSPRNMILYAKDAFPNGFIATRGFKTHNAWIDVLTSTGITGLITCISFAIRKIKQVFSKGIFSLSVSHRIEYLYFLSVVILTGFSFLVNVIFFTNDVCSFLFWLFLGYLVSHSPKKKLNSFIEY
ncbi:hypothetical protein FC84_GL001194 [Lapidilactobacillus dextrinicus DSM 20335]|uniref:O-antigen ligase-related domain-containing protein n=1 Tax=Lapidilactobacillus dextrinicus DSM 20335 TaxID=1423738 RepID=A0A0R2BRC2_9LACO|nr:O-antigen ligase family protein [Lapidilactobacillus dextrinicus]KRM78172.1 hypothetical protein FC84_GL001194 [Lapidilactobacillus dextrinicus DSM 20335]QFG47133.1 O-antigen ligase domain-containing protein [Lapidilactobacillus dextrinicus]